MSGCEVTTQVPFEQVSPAPQVTPAHGSFCTHWPATHISPAPHSTLLHGSATHWPFWQISPVPHSTPAHAPPASGVLPASGFLLMSAPLQVPIVSTVLTCAT